MDDKYNISEDKLCDMVRILSSSRNKVVKDRFIEIIDRYYHNGIDETNDVNSDMILNKTKNEINVVIKKISTDMMREIVDMYSISKNMKYI